MVAMQDAALPQMATTQRTDGFRNSRCSAGSMQLVSNCTGITLCVPAGILYRDQYRSARYRTKYHIESLLLLYRFGVILFSIFSLKADASYESSV